jgi:hypothetical protein
MLHSRGGSPPASLKQPDGESPIKFGSFSLGDMFEKEIQKFGRFAFRGKHSSGEAPKKFIDEFIRIRHEARHKVEFQEEEGGAGLP